VRLLAAPERIVMRIRRVALWALGFGALLALTVGSIALAGTLRIPDQAGQPLGVDPVSIVGTTAPTAAPTGAAVAVPDDNGGDAGSSGGDTVTVVPAPDPVVVEEPGDDHGGTSGNSGSGSSGSGTGGHGSDD
jgi:hypothetical protein